MAKKKNSNLIWLALLGAGGVGLYFYFRQTPATLSTALPGGTVSPGAALPAAGNAVTNPFGSTAPTVAATTATPAAATAQAIAETAAATNPLGIVQSWINAEPNPGVRAQMTGFANGLSAANLQNLALVYTYFQSGKAFPAALQAWYQTVVNQNVGFHW